MTLSRLTLYHYRSLLLSLAIAIAISITISHCHYHDYRSLSHTLTLSPTIIVTYYNSLLFYLLIKVNSLPVLGTSAGALAATLLVTGANFDQAADIAINQAHKYKLFDSQAGLAGVW
jgi:hypothetical protein